MKIEDRGSNLLAAAIGSGEQEEGNAITESVDIDLNKHLKPRGFADQTRSSQMFDFAMPSSAAGSPVQDIFTAPAQINKPQQ